MAKRSLKASETGIVAAKRAYERTGWTQEYLAAEVGLSTRQSVWKFFSGRAIERHIFIELCFVLNLDWQDISDSPQHIPGQVVQKESKEQITDIDQLVTAVRSQIAEKIQSQCGTLQSSFEFAQPLELEHTFTNVNFLTSLSHQRWLEVSDLQEAHSSSQRLNLITKEGQTIPALEAIATESRLVILGKPGAGKTTLLQYLALQCSQGEFKAEQVPVFISLRAYALQAKETKDTSLLDYIGYVWSSQELEQKQVESLLQQGRVLILLDGLDELPQEQSNDIAQEIQQFSELYYQNQIIITCRLAAQQFMFRGFTYIEVADFNPTQIETFAQKWFVATAKNTEEGETKAQQFIEQLQRRENLPIRELVITPILLSLVCSVFQAKSSFPTKRARLYQEGLEILLVRWDRARGIQRDRIYRNLSLPDKIKLLSQIATITFERGDYFFEKNEILQIIADFLLQLPDSDSEPEVLRLNSETVLKAIEIQHGLLVQRARDIYSFSHLTFHEYLAARKIVASQDVAELEPSLKQLATHVSQPQWREVILLSVSMLKDADFLLLEIKKQIEAAIASIAKLQHFLSFLEDKVSSLKVPYDPSAVKAFYLCLFQNRDLSLAISLDPKLAAELDHELALDLALARTLDNAIALVENPDIKQILNFSFALELENSFQLTPAMNSDLQNLKSQLPDLGTSKEHLITWWGTNGEDWVTKFRNLINEHRYQGQDWDFDPQQQKLLQQYYETHQFLVECLETDCRISSEVKSQIAL